MEDSTPSTTNQSDSSRVDTKDTPEDFDYEKLSDMEEENEDEVEYIYNSAMLSFTETAQSDDDNSARIKQESESEFPVGKKFDCKEEAKVAIHSFSAELNIPFEFYESDKVYTKMVCKHYGGYRSSRKGKMIYFKSRERYQLLIK